jgi:hypothetical protein
VIVDYALGETIEQGPARWDDRLCVEVIPCVVVSHALPLTPRLAPIIKVALCGAETRPMWAWGAPVAFNPYRDSGVCTACLTAVRGRPPD